MLFFFPEMPPLCTLRASALPHAFPAFRKILKQTAPLSAAFLGRPWPLDRAL
jgi:hypothetical protein